MGLAPKRPLGTSVDLSTRLATSQWDCSDGDLHAVTVTPLGIDLSMNHTNNLYGDGAWKRKEMSDSKLAAKCLKAAEWVSKHIPVNSNVYTGTERLELRIRLDGAKPQRLWLLGIHDILLHPLPKGMFNDHEVDNADDVGGKRKMLVQCTWREKSKSSSRLYFQKKSHP